jgi:hypothetical protein
VWPKEGHCIHVITRDWRAAFHLTAIDNHNVGPIDVGLAVGKVNQPVDGDL